MSNSSGNNPTVLVFKIYPESDHCFLPLLLPRWIKPLSSLPWTVSSLVTSLFPLLSPPYCDLNTAARLILSLMCSISFHSFSSYLVGNTKPHDGLSNPTCSGPIWPHLLLLSFYFHFPTLSSLTLTNRHLSLGCGVAVPLAWNTCETWLAFSLSAGFSSSASSSLRKEHAIRTLSAISSTLYSISSAFILRIDCIPTL